MIKNQALSFLLLLFVFFSCKKNSSEKIESLILEKKNTYNKIHVSISNIPKIQFKVITGLNSYKINKNATLTYKLHNVAEVTEIKYDSLNNNIEKEFDVDTLYLGLRYNPGKHQTFILRRGDSAKINYVNQKPILELKTRLFKKHDLDVINAISKYDSIDNNSILSFLNPLGKANREKEKLKLINAYSKILKVLDSLSKNNLLSDAEYHYYKKRYSYKKAIKENKFDIKKLNKTDLHQDAYTLYMRQYVFKNLKKKIISLGNGMSRNFLESFDFVYSNDNFSLENKKYLLKNALRNIKKDFPKSVYNKRLKKYNMLFKEDSISKEKLKNRKSINKYAKDVILRDANDNRLTLAEILKENKGKNIYIDFWASWCAPCRAAFPSYKSLKKEYLNKNIIFIFISGDQNFSKWHKANTKEKLTNSYFAENYPKAKLYTELNLRSFPRYLIFNKKGDLVNERAPGPDSDTIRGFLDEVINESL